MGGGGREREYYVGGGVNGGVDIKGVHRHSGLLTERLKVVSIIFNLFIYLSL